MTDAVVVAVGTSAVVVLVWGTSTDVDTIAHDPAAGTVVAVGSSVVGTVASVDSQVVVGTSATASAGLEALVGTSAAAVASTAAESADVELDAVEFAAAAADFTGNVAVLPLGVVNVGGFRTIPCLLQLRKR